MNRMLLMQLMMLGNKRTCSSGDRSSLLLYRMTRAGMERTSITNTAASTTNAGSITTHHFHAIIASIRSVSVTTCETVHPPPTHEPEEHDDHCQDESENEGTVGHARRANHCHEALSMSPLSIANFRREGRRIVRHLHGLLTQSVVQSLSLNTYACCKLSFSHPIKCRTHPSRG